MTRKQPERLILHLDMDSYFASVEQQQNPALRGRPIGVAGKPGTRTVVAGSSREAKTFGVKSGMSTWEAQRLCPSIQFVRGDLTHYQKATRTWVQILREFSPVLEIFSIDEAFLDITDTSPRFGGPLEIARRIKKGIRQKLGAYITGSIGVAENKILAKLVGKWGKPNGIVILDPEQIPQILATTAPSALCGIGPQTARRLEQLGIRTLQDLGNYPLSNLRAVFGVQGETLKLWGHGLDPAPVVPYWIKTPVKSIGHSFTLPKQVATFAQAQPVLFRLAERVARELRRQKLLGKTVSLSLRNLQFETQTRQKSLATPTNDEGKIFTTCLTLQHSFRNFDQIRLVGVSISNLSSQADSPLTLFQDRRASLLATVDSINRRFGEVLVHAASLPADRILVAPVGYGRNRHQF